MLTHIKCRGGTFGVPPLVHVFFIGIDFAVCVSNVRVGMFDIPTLLLITWFGFG